MRSSQTSWLWVLFLVLSLTTPLNSKAGFIGAGGSDGPLLAEDCLNGSVSRFPASSVYGYG